MFACALPTNWQNYKIVLRQEDSREVNTHKNQVWIPVFNFIVLISAENWLLLGSLSLVVAKNDMLCVRVRVYASDWLPQSTLANILLRYYLY